MKNIVSLTLIAVSILLFFFYIRPQWAVITGLQAQKADYTDALAKAKDVKTLSDSLLAKYNSISPEDQAKLAAMIPSDFNSVKLVADINAIAARYGMSIKGVAITNQANTTPPPSASVTTAPPAAPYTASTIAFTVTGQYADFLSFLQDLEDNVELVDIKKLDVHSGGTLGPSGAAAPVTSNSTLGFSVTLQTYHIN